MMISQEDLQIENQKATETLMVMVNRIIARLEDVVSQLREGNTVGLGIIGLAHLIEDEFDCPFALAQGVVSYWVSKHRKIVSVKGNKGGIQFIDQPHNPKKNMEQFLDDLIGE